MPTQITQVEDEERGKTLLRVEGAMMLEDAVLLEKIALDMRSGLGRDITLDLADLDFLDSESASVLKRLEDRHGFELEGMEIFLQTAVNDVERAPRV
jgi:anti-anti-sigma regulatory factor